MKKLFSAIVSFVILCASLCAMTSNAEYVTSTRITKDADEFMSQLTPVEPPSFLQNKIEDKLNYYATCDVYRYKKEDRLSYKLLCLDRSFRSITIYAAEGFDTASMKELLKEGGFSDISAYINEWTGEGSMSVSGESDAERLRKAEEWCEFLKDSGAITDFVYHPYYYNAASVDYGADFCIYRGTGITNEDKKDDVADMDEALNKLIGEEGLTWHTEVASTQLSVKLVPDFEATIDDKLAVAELVYDELGYFPQQKPSETNLKFYISGAIDMYNAIGGDANCDMVLSIADATAVLQSIVNPAKYPLSMQGEYNADIDGDHDGITPADALAIQMLDAEAMQ